METSALFTWSDEDAMLLDAFMQEVMLLRAQHAKDEHEKAELRTRNDELRKKVQELTAAAMLPKSERRPDLTNGQMVMDLGDAAPVRAEEPDPDKQNPPAVPGPERTVRRRRRKPSVNALLDLLPVLETVDDDAAVPDCPECGGGMFPLAYDTYKELVIRPAQVGVRVHRSPVFGCRDCEHHNVLVPIIHAGMQLCRPLDRCVASPEALAYLVYMKIALSVPLYRIERALQEMDAPLSRMTMTNWMTGAADRWLEPLAEMIRQAMLQQDILQADETSAHVLIEEGRTRQARGYAWIYVSPQTAAVRFVYLEYQASHAAECPMKVLDGFRGTLVTDGYSAYRRLTDLVTCIFLSGCWAHCRRAWYKAVQSGDPNGPAGTGFAFVQKLFAFESDFADLTPQERFIERLQHVKPHLDRFHSWLTSQHTGTTKLGKAVQYTLNNWESLYNYLSDGRLPATNAESELIARSFAVGRKNFMFSNSMQGMTALMASYSVVETARANDLNVYAYLLWIFSEMPRTWEECRALLDPAFEKVQAMADHEFAQMVPLIEASLKTPDLPGLSHVQLRIAAAEAVREKIIDPVRRELEEKLTREGRLRCAREFLPQHAPPNCRAGTWECSETQPDKPAAAAGSSR